MTDKSVTKPYTYVPIMKLRLFVQALFRDDICGNKDKVESVTGVSRQIFYYHMKKNPNFKRWFADYCSDFLSLHEDFVSAQLLKNIKNGSDQAIRTYYQLRGKLRGDALINTGDVHIGDKTEVHVTNNYENTKVVNVIPQLSPAQIAKLRMALMEWGLLTEPKERSE